jgi:hypothetical protein
LQDDTARGSHEGGWIGALDKLQGQFSKRAPT